MGFSLEYFDAIGKFRAEEDGVKVDASGSLPGGINFVGPSGLKQMVMNRKEYFVECISEKMLTYALGRGLELRDRAAVRRIVDRLRANGYRFSELILGVVESEPFRRRRGEGGAL